MAEIRLAEDSKERRMYEDRADLYAIIKTTQHLEKAYVRDAIGPEEYTNACQRLLAQYKTTEAALRSEATWEGTEQFMRDYKMDCTLALQRIKAGVPATVIYAHSDQGSKDSAMVVAEATQWFITCMDIIKLEQYAVDQVQPSLKDLMGVLNKSETIAPGFDKSRLQNWLIELSGMRASQELDEDQARQLYMDLESAYSNFKTSLSSKS